MSYAFDKRPHVTPTELEPGHGLMPKRAITAAQALEALDELEGGERMKDKTIAALQAVEDWWLTQADRSGGAPACIFQVREALAEHKRVWVETPGDNLMLLPVHDARLALWKAMQQAGLVGNPTDDKLIVAELGKQHIYLARDGAGVPDTKGGEHGA